MPSSNKERRSSPRRTKTGVERQKPALTRGLDNEPALWAAVNQGDTSSINQLVSHYQPVAHFIASARAGRGIGIQELNDEATRALRHAVCKFEPTRNGGFEAFAVV